MQNISPIVKSTNDCNLRCSYCYVSDDNGNPRFFMPDGVLSSTVSKILDYNNPSQPTEFIWHGGEPLLAGTDFFNGALSYQEQYSRGHDIENSIQTNLTILDEKILSFLSRNNFRVGTSIDGLAQTHDANRKTKAGRGTFDTVYTNLKRVKDAGLKVGAIVTLNRQNLGEMQNIYSLFRDLGVNFRINPVFYATREERYTSDFSMTPREYGLAMNELFDLWFFDKDHKIEIDTFVNILDNLLHKNLGDCHYSGSCQSGILLIDPNGDVYPCDKFDKKPEFVMGNIATDTLKRILDSPIRKSLMSRNVGEIDDCKSCEQLDLCNGGCMYDGFVETEDFNAKSYFCEGDFLMFDHIKKRVSEQLERARIKKSND